MTHHFFLNKMFGHKFQISFICNINKEYIATVNELTEQTGSENKTKMCIKAMSFVYCLTNN